ncbi:protein kinase domain-containing protein [Leptospira licerasiae]|uniref:protein kinase domain-containing protein n=1 Tax=Leptospira licerasiae TaxID=447106 RepID=UPI0030165D87
MTESAAQNLLHHTLDSGWVVKEKITKSDNQTGAFFSACYIVEKQYERCFLKAFDYAKFLVISKPGSKTVDILQQMLTAYQYERDLSDHCRGKHVTKVSFVKEAGETFVPGFTITHVPYLIFDLADGDVRKRLEFSENLDYAWRFKSLHDIAIGLKQLHRIEVSHQDLKPSNILVFNSESKLGDLGRSVCGDMDGPYNRMDFSGDRSYAPPEILYGFFEPDFRKRVFAADAYLLGSLIVFYFIGLSMTALLRKNLPDEFSWEQWNGTFDEVKPYVEEAFYQSLNEFELGIKEKFFKPHLREMVEFLCHPDPLSRGHKDRLSIGNPYDLERFISKFDYLRRKAQYAAMRSNGRSN